MHGEKKDKETNQENPSGKATGSSQDLPELPGGGFNKPSAAGADLTMGPSAEQKHPI